MTNLYVYALLRGLQGGDEGSSKEPVTLVACGGIDAAVAPVSEAPATDAAALRAHDAVVRQLCERSPAVLPMRFGSLVGDETALRQWVDRVRPILEHGLDVVAGREQMVLRLYGDAGPPASEEGETASGGRGTRYLRRRTPPPMPDALGRALEAVRCRLERLVLDEQVERHRTPPLLVTLRHLVRRDTSEAYRAALSGDFLQIERGTMQISGPWPPYAFTPTELS